MDIRLKDIERFIKINPCVLVNVEQVKGSTPRNIDAFMLVNEKESIGTIGGGNLEFMAIEHARKMIVNNEIKLELDIALGEKNNQCCGGRVKINLRILDKNLTDELIKKAKKQEADLPHIYLFGAGHVGKALANLLAQMPYNTMLIDSRPNVMNDIPAIIKTKLTPLPEMIIKEAKANSVFVVFAHDHSIDFLLMEEILNRNDFCFAGMIGSKTKRKKFENFYIRNGGKKPLLKKMICPIGGDEIVDKRPSIIAALTLAQIISNIKH